MRLLRKELFNNQKDWILMLPGICTTHIIGMKISRIFVAPKILLEHTLWGIEHSPQRTWLGARNTSGWAYRDKPCVVLVNVEGCGLSLNYGQSDIGHVIKVRGSASRTQWNLGSLRRIKRPLVDEGDLIVLQLGGIQWVDQPANNQMIS